MRRLFVVLGAIAVLSWFGSARATTQDVMAFYDQIEAQLAAEDYDGLESTIEELRRTDRRLDGGVSGVFLFYRTLAKRQLYADFWIDYRWPAITEEQFQGRRAVLEAWRNARPESPTPRVALAALWSDYAWKGRGSEFSSKVASAQWQAFRARLEAEEELLSGIPLNDPGIFQITLTYARDAGWPRASVDRLYRQAVQKHPTYLHLYVQYAALLSPKWFGAPGDVAAYAESLLQDPGGDIGLMAYSLVVAQQVSQKNQLHREFFQKSGFRWEETKAGFALREQRYGLSNADWNLLLYYAGSADDRATALKAIEHIGDKWAEWIWHDQKTFARNIAWARQEASGQ